MYVESDTSDSSVPVLVVVRHQTGVLSWQLPMLIQDQESEATVVYTAVNRTICPEEIWSKPGVLDFSDHRVTISISTASESAVPFSMSLYLEPEYIITVNKGWVP